MNREDAITLLMMVQLDRAPPPPIEPEKMAALFVSVISDDPPDGQPPSPIMRTLVTKITARQPARP